MDNLIEITIEYDELVAQARARTYKIIWEMHHLREKLIKLYIYQE